MRTAGRIALVTLYLFALLEVTSRVWVWISETQLDASYGYPADLFAPHETRGYAYVPGYRGHFPNPSYAHIEIAIDERGFRNDPPRDAAPAPTILVVGDSITFGAGIPARDRYTDELERIVCPEGRCRVLNLGVNGYQVENYTAVLREQLPDLRPEWVMIGFCMNDIQAKAGLEQIAQATRTGAVERIRGLLARSTFLRLAARSARAVTFDPEEHKHRWIRRAMAAWAAPERRDALDLELRAIRELALAHGARVLAIVFPERNQLEDFRAFGAPYEAAGRAFERAGIPALSGRRLLGLDADAPAETLDALFLPGDNIHFTPEGHRRIAHALAREIGSMGEGPRTSGPQVSPDARQEIGAP